MTPLTSRQADILRLVVALGRPNVNDLVRGRQSPSKLKHNLDELVVERNLRMEPVGNEHRYTITKLGRSRLIRHEADTADASIARLGRMDLPSLLKLLDSLREHVRTTWCSECGGTNIERGWDELGDAEIQVCMECHAANVMNGTLAEYEVYVKEEGFKVPAFDLKERDEKEIGDRAKRNREIFFRRSLERELKEIDILKKREQQGKAPSE